MDSVTVLLEMVTPETVFASEIEPMLMPCLRMSVSAMKSFDVLGVKTHPPLHVFPLNTMLLPELIAMLSRDALAAETQTK